jgi:hypothetical protein
MIERFNAGDYEAVWSRRLALGHALSGEDADPEVWFWLNALPALSELRQGRKDHPFVSTAAAWADEAYRGISERSDSVEGAMAEVNSRYFG